MQIQIHAKNVDLSDRLQDYADKKLNRLNRFLPNITRIELELAQERHKQGGDRSIAQITVRHSRGTILRAEDRTQNDPFAAIDVTLDKMLRQISRFKDKHRRRSHAAVDFEGAEPLPEAIEAETEANSDGANVDILRRKRIDVAPMGEEEAIEQMELLGHDFFVFFNVDVKAVNVLYRRKEGGYGLIDPVIGK